MCGNLQISSYVHVTVVQASIFLSIEVIAAAPRSSLIGVHCTGAVVHAAGRGGEAPGQWYEAEGGYQRPAHRGPQCGQVTATQVNKLNIFYLLKPIF